MEGKRFYYLQYPLGFRQDPDIKRLERKFGICAPMVFLEINALVADKNFRITRRPDETFEEQLSIDLDYDGETELIRNVIGFCMERNLIIREDSEGEEVYYFPWAEKQTASRSEEAIRKAAYRKQKKEGKGGSWEGVGEDLGRTWDNLGQCPDNVRTDEDTLGQCPDNVPDTSDDVPEYRRRERERRKEEGEIKKEEDIETIVNIDGRMEGSPSILPVTWKDNFKGVLFRGGKIWVPSDEEYQMLKASFPTVNVDAQLQKMRMWAERKGGITTSNRPISVAYNWMTKENHGQAREAAEEILKARKQQKARATPDEWEELARRVNAGEVF